MVEAGLIGKWKLQTWNRMRENSDQEPVAFVNPPAAEPLTLDTLQAAFLPAGLLLGLSLVTLAVELFGGRVLSGLNKRTKSKRTVGFDVEKLSRVKSLKS